MLSIHMKVTLSFTVQSSAVPDSAYISDALKAFLYLLLALQREARVHILALGQVQTEQQTFIHNHLRLQSQ